MQQGKCLNSQSQGYLKAVENVKTVNLTLTLVGGSENVTA